VKNPNPSLVRSKVDESSLIFFAIDRVSLALGDMDGMEKALSSIMALYVLIAPVLTPEQQNEILSLYDSCSCWDDVLSLSLLVMQAAHGSNLYLKKMQYSRQNDSAWPDEAPGGEEVDDKSDKPVES